MLRDTVTGHVATLENAREVLRVVLSTFEAAGYPPCTPASMRADVVRLVLGGSIPAAIAMLDAALDDVRAGLHVLS